MADKKEIVIAPCRPGASLFAVEAAAILIDAFSSVEPDLTYINAPLSTGGAGTIEVIKRYCSGRCFSVPALCGDDRRRNVEYYLTPDKIAVVEAASLLGSPFCSLRSPGGITSYGVGSVAVDAMKKGATRLLFALGDTYNIDGGCGVARALGALFLTDRGKPFTPTGATLDEICYIDREKLLSIDAVCLCDTNDLLLGDVGTVGRYAREIGHFPEQMPRLMNNLCHLHDLIRPEKVAEEGDGAGGGIGYMLRTMFGAKLRNGVEQIMKLSEFPTHAPNAEWIITVLPHLDTRMQTENYLRALRKHAKSTRIAAICSDISPDFIPEFSGLSATITLNPDATDLKSALYDAGVQLAMQLL